MDRPAKDIFDLKKKGEHESAMAAARQAQRKAQEAQRECDKATARARGERGDASPEQLHGGRLVIMVPLRVAQGLCARRCPERPRKRGQGEGVLAMHGKSAVFTYTHTPL